MDNRVRFWPPAMTGRQVVTATWLTADSHGYAPMPSILPDHVARLRPPAGVIVSVASDDALLGEPAAAAMIGCSTRTLARHRSAGSGPPYERLGRRLIAYRRSAIEGWLANGTVAAEG